MVSIFSCEKKSDPAPTNTQKLTGKNWRVVTMTVSPALAGITDFLSTVDACDRDNFLNFNANGTYVENEGTTKCNPSDPQTKTLNWSWSNNETKIIKDGDTYDVLQNDGNVLRISFTEIDNGVSYTVTVTFNK